MQVLPFQLAPELDELYQHFTQELVADPKVPSTSELLKMYRFCPYNSLAIRFLALRAAGALGEYDCSNKQLFRVPTGQQTIKEWTLSNFETMRGSLRQSVKKMLAQACCIGYSVAEIVNTSEMKGHEGEWRLSQLKVLNPHRYTFAGREGEWDRIIYKSSRKGEYPIPRQKLLHIYFPSVEEPENPLGLALGIRGYPYYKARTLALKIWSEQLIRNLKGLTIIQGDSNLTVAARDNFGAIAFGLNGEPIQRSALQQHVENISTAKDGSVVGLDKQFTYQHYPQTGSMGSDFDLFLNRASKDIFRAYGIPDTIFGEGSAVLGQAGLNYGHRLILDAQIEDVIEMVRSQILEMAVRPLLAANFGITHQDDYGYFKTDKFLPPEQSQMRANLISSGMLQGLIDPNDLEAINQYRKDCGLNPVSAEDYNQQQVRKMLEAQAQQPLQAFEPGGNEEETTG